MRRVSIFQIISICNANATMAEDTLIRIGYNNQPGLHLAPATQYDSVCGMMKTLMGFMGVKK
jgi:hypothetical protein